MNFNLLVKFLDGTETTVSGIAADLVAFETHFDMSVARLNKDVKITHLLFLAWHVLKRTGDKNAVKGFDSWVETVGTVEASDPKE